MPAMVESRALPAAEPTHGRRRPYWVLPKMQRRLILWLVVVSSVVAAGAVLVVLLAIWSPLANRFVWAGQGTEVENLFWETCMRVLLTTGVLIAIFAVVAFVIGFVVSHRMVRAHVAELQKALDTIEEAREAHLAGPARERVPRAGWV